MFDTKSFFPFAYLDLKQTDLALYSYLK